MDEIIGEEIFLIDKIIAKTINWLISSVPTLLIIIVLFLISRWLIKALLKRISKSIKEKVHHSEGNVIENDKRADTLLGIIQGTISIGLWAIFFLLFIKELGVDIAPLLAGAGILGLAVGFGAQELVRDGISGFFLILEDRIRVGDVVALNGTGGLVENINLRTVTLRDLSGVVHTFQNGKINTMSNMTKEWSAMVFDIGIAYKENVNNVIDTVREVGEELKKDELFKDKIIEPIEIFGLDKFADSAVVIKARIKTKPIEQWSVGREFNKRLKVAFDDRGIEIPFPHRTIYWGQDISPLKINDK